MMIRFISRRALLVLAVGLALLAAVSVTFLLARDGAAQQAGLGTRSATAGTTEVTMTALVLDTSGAQFRLVLDTHTASLDQDLARSTQLRVAGRLVGADTWEGAGPGGHHREGTLRFATPVPAGAEVELRLAGLPGEAVGTWIAP